MIVRKGYQEIVEIRFSLSSAPHMPGLMVMKAFSSISQADSYTAAYLPPPHTQLIYCTGEAGRQSCFRFGSDFPLDLQHDLSLNIPKCLSLSHSHSRRCKRTPQQNAVTLCVCSGAPWDSRQSENKTKLLQKKLSIYCVVD